MSGQRAARVNHAVHDQVVAVALERVADPVDRVMTSSAIDLLLSDHAGLHQRLSPRPCPALEQNAPPARPAAVDRSPVPRQTGRRPGQCLLRCLLSRRYSHQRAGVASLGGRLTRHDRCRAGASQMAPPGRRTASAAAPPAPEGVCRLRPGNHPPALGPSGHHLGPAGREDPWLGAPPPGLRHEPACLVMPGRGRLRPFLPGGMAGPAGRLPSCWACR